MNYDIGGMYVLVSSRAREMAAQIAALDWKMEAPERGECDEYPDEVIVDASIERKDLILELEAILYWDNESLSERYDLELAKLAEVLVKEQFEDIKAKRKGVA